MGMSTRQPARAAQSRNFAGDWSLSIRVAALAFLCAVWLATPARIALTPVFGDEPPKLNIADELPAFGAGSFGAFGEGETITAKATVKSNEGGLEGQLSVEVQIAPEFHLYSVTQPPGGPLRTKLDVVANPPLEMLGAFKPDRAPSVRRVPEYPGVNLEEHADKVVWSAPVRLPSGVNLDSYRVQVKLSGLTCRDNDSCIPVRSTVDAKLTGFKVPGGGDAPLTPAKDAERSSPVVNAIDPPEASRNTSPAKNSPALLSFVGKPGPYRAALSHGEIDGYLEPSRVAPGGKVKLVLTGKPQPGWHFYVTAPKDVEDGSPFKRTLIAIQDWPYGLPTANKPTETKESPDGKPPVVYYDGEVTWSVEVSVPADAAPGPVALQGIIGYQTCDAGSCDRPTGAAFQARFEIGEGAANENRVPLEFQSSSYKKAADLAAGKAPTPTPPPSGATRGQADTAASTPAERPFRKWDDVEIVTGDDKDATLGSVLLLAAIGGFLLNFMPCVLPVIGLKIMSFVQQAHGDRKKVFLLNLYYFLGLIAVFMILATLAAVFQFGWGKQFQSTGFNVALAGVVFVFALSMLGVWEIPLPGFVGSGAAAEASEHEGPLGAFLKGALTTVLATPCTGPFMGTALTWAAKQPAPVIYATFFALGLGMGLPYLALGAFPQLLKFLPKPGAWMETFKQVMGFVLLGTVVFIYTFLHKDYLVATSGLLVGLGIACWWIGKTPVYAETAQKLTAWGVGVFIAGSIGWSSFSFLGPSMAVLPWNEFSRNNLEQMIDEGRTVMVDFTADWCLTCKVNEKTALNTAKTLSLVNSQDIVVIKADKTNEGETSDSIDQLLSDLGNKSYSIPFLVIFPGDGSRPIAFSGPVTQGMIADAIRRAGPSQSASKGKSNGRQAAAPSPSERSPRS
jgi:suppressor for copper-sensitivity B